MSEVGPGGARPARLALAYLLAGIAWIVVTDGLVRLGFEPQLGPRLQMLKGLAFVGLSALLVYGLARRALGALEAERARLRELFDANPDPLFIYDGERGVFLDANRRATEQYGRSRAELLAIDPLDLTAPPSRERAARAIAQRAAGPRRMRLEHQDRAGRSFPVEMACEPLSQLGAGVVLCAVRDLTALRRAEQASAEGEARFEALFECSPVAIYSVDPAGVVLSWNRAAERLFGWSAEEVLGEPLPSVGEEERGEFDALRARVLAGESLLGLEVVRRRRDGERVHLRLSAAPILAVDGRPVAKLVVAEDREAEQRHLAALEESERRFRHAILEAPIPMILHAEDEVLALSAAWCRLSGYPAERLTRLSDWIELACPADRRDDVWRWIDAIYEAPGPVPPSESQIRAGDGSWRTWELHSTALGRLADGRRCVVSAALDLTERRAAEVQQRRLLAALEQLDEAVVFSEPGGTIAYVNEAFERTTGYSREEVLGRESQLVHGADPAHFHELERGLETQDTWRGRLESTSKSGRAYVEAVTVSRVRDPGGAPLGQVWVKQDITEQLTREEELRQAQRLESVGRLAGGVAHDFNNLLTVILGRCELELERANILPTSRSAFQVIQRAATSSAELTGQLLAIARRQPAAPTSLALDDHVEHLLGVLRRLLGEDVVLDWRPGAPGSHVLMAGVQLDQVLVNLCANARDAIAGAGTVDIETWTQHADEAYCRQHPDARPGDYVVCAVSDDGCGMTPEVRQRMFEPFFSTKAGAGTGMGLATTYGIVRQNGGFIRVYSEPGQGSTFEIHLPVLASEAAPSQGDAAQAQEVVRGPGAGSARAQRTVLVVEDEPDLLELARELLEHLGYTVVTAARPRAALQLDEEQLAAVDLVLTDLVMPELDGKELSRRLRARRPELRVVFTSGYAPGRISHSGLLEEGDLFLPKPYDLRRLEQVVHDALAGPRPGG
ncbi:MAG: PAS domain S-box protein [Planctomycetota bacterium]